MIPAGITSEHSHTGKVVVGLWTTHQNKAIRLKQLNSNRHSPTNIGTFPLFIFKPEIFLRHIGTHIIKDILLAVETQIYSTALS